MNTVNWNIIIPCIATLASGTLGYFAGFIKDARFQKREMLEKRFYGFYVPFINLAGKSLLNYASFSDLKEENRLLFLKLLSNERMLASTELQSLFFQLDNSYREKSLFQIKKDFVSVEKCNGRINECFEYLSVTVGRETILMCRKLKLPIPHLPPLKLDPRMPPTAIDRLQELK